MNFPNAIEAEKGLLGSVLIDPRLVAPCIREGIAADTFFHSPHAILWETITAMEEAGSPIDFKTITIRLRDKNQIQYFGNGADISELYSYTPTTANRKEYSKILLEKQRRRNLMKEGMRLASMAENESEDILEIEGVAQNIGVDSAKSVTGSEDVRHIKHAAVEFINSVELAQTGKDDRFRMEFGLPRFELLTHNIPPGNHVVIGAQTSVGKTAFALQCAWTVSHKQQKPVLFVSLEMTQQKLAARIVSAISGISLSKLHSRTPDLTYGDLDSMGSSLLRVNGSQLYLWTPSITPTAQQITAMMRMQKIEHPDLALVIIDYLQLVSPSNHKESRERQVAEASSTIMRAAVGLNVVTIALSQLNDDNKLRESRAIGHDARIVGRLIRHCEEDEEDDGTRTLHIDKNSEGQAMVSIPMHFDGPHQTFREVTE